MEAEMNMAWVVISLEKPKSGKDIINVFKVAAGDKYVEMQQPTRKGEDSVAIGAESSSISTTVVVRVRSSKQGDKIAIKAKTKYYQIVLVASQFLDWPINKIKNRNWDQEIAEETVNSLAAKLHNLL